VFSLLSLSSACKGNEEREREKRGGRREKERERREDIEYDI
jgi:hypothetical protein